MMDDDTIFFGSGQCHDLRDGDEDRPRLLGFRSVSDAAAWAMHKPGPAPKPTRMGFDTRAHLKGRR